MRFLIFIFCLSLPLSVHAQKEGLYDIEDVIYISYWTPLKLIAVIGSLVIFCLLLFYWIRKKFKKPLKKETPYEKAINQLKGLAANLNQYDDRALCITASNIVRYYLEESLNVPAPERTTEEFLIEIEHHALVQGIVKEVLSGFLTQCDFVKFARESFDVNARSQLIAQASSLVETIHHAKQEEEKRRQQTIAS